MYHNSAIFVNFLVQLQKCNLSPELHRSQTLTGLKRKAASCFWYICTLVIVCRTQLRRSPKCVDVPGISRILTRVLGCYRTLISSLLLRSRDDIREVTPSYLGNILYVANSKHVCAATTVATRLKHAPTMGHSLQLPGLHKRSTATQPVRVQTLPASV